MKHIITFLFLGFALVVNAQVKKTLHQTFEVDEENKEITLDIYDEFQTEEWASDNIMAVTTVTLESGAQHVLDFYVREGRYNLDKTGEDGVMNLTSKDKIRKGMKYKGHTIFEIISMKLFIPENYELVGKNKLVKKAEEDDTVSTDQK